MGKEVHQRQLELWLEGRGRCSTPNGESTNPMKSIQQVMSEIGLEVGLTGSSRHLISRQDFPYFFSNKGLNSAALKGLRLDFIAVGNKVQLNASRIVVGEPDFGSYQEGDLTEGGAIVGSVGIKVDRGQSSRIRELVGLMVRKDGDLRFSMRQIDDQVEVMATTTSLSDLYRTGYWLQQQIAFERSEAVFNGVSYDGADNDSMVQFHIALTEIYGQLLPQTRKEIDKIGHSPTYMAITPP